MLHNYPLSTRPQLWKRSTVWTSILYQSIPPSHTGECIRGLIISAEFAILSLLWLLESFCVPGSYNKLHWNLLFTIFITQQIVPFRPTLQHQCRQNAGSDRWRQATLLHHIPESQKRRACNQKNQNTSYLWWVTCGGREINGVGLLTYRKRKDISIPAHCCYS